ncbi:hypothetical protein Tco_0827112, partial [Tanacetum coccineum]
MQEVILFYNGLGIPTRHILDSRGAIPSKIAADAKVAIQEVAEYSQKWHNRTSRSRSSETSDILAAIRTITYSWFLLDFIKSRKTGSETRHPMLNKENYVPWSSRLLRYAKSRPNEKLIYNSIMNDPYVRRMIPEPGDADREVLVNETFHEQTDDELTEKELIQKELQKVMAEPILNENMEKAQTESNLSITSNDINIELSKEFLEELQMNAYHRWIDEDVMDHIAKVLKMIDLIYIPGVDSHQLRMKVFPLSLADDVRKWWINEREEKIIVWEELVEKFFCKFYLESYDGEEEMLDEGDNWGINPLEFISRSDTEKEDELSQKKRKYSNISKSIDEKPNKRMCKAEKFEAIQYSLGPNKEYIAIRRCEYDICERNKDNTSKIYQDIFQKKDNGWK